MAQPRIYVHRINQSCPYDLYMNAENEALLASFAEVANNGRGKDPVSPEEMVKQLTGVRGILSLNGSGATEMTTDVLKQAGTVQVAAISHWWHGSHNEVWNTWGAAGVTMIDASDGCNEAVAEWAVGAAITGLRRFEHFDREFKAGTLWPERHGVARQLTGGVFGIVGLGRVGRLVAKYLRPFSVRILGYDPFITKEQAAEMGVELVALNDLLKAADAVSLHLAVAPATRGIIGARELALMKEGALLINCARAALTDGPALRAALATKRIRAYLDVYQPEPPPLDDPLRHMDNVVMTPHVAGQTDAMFIDCGRRAILALRDYFAKE